MNTRTTVVIAFALVLTCAVSPLSAQDLVNFAEDSAGNYHGGWESGTNGGYGFGPWQLVAKHGEGQSYAGFFVARKQDQPDLQKITRNMAFGMYANGVEFEEAVAFRSFAEALRVGEAFSVLLEHGPIRAKFERTDPAAGSIGLALRSGNASDATGDYNKGARFEFVYVEGDETYRIIDGEGEEKWDTGLPITADGIELTFILTDEDRYDLQLRVLGSDRVHQWNGRRLGGERGTLIESFAIFNRDAEAHDLYFEGLQVNREEANR